MKHIAEHFQGRNCFIPYLAVARSVSTFYFIVVVQCKGIVKAITLGRLLD